MVLWRHAAEWLIGGSTFAFAAQGDAYAQQHRGTGHVPSGVPAHVINQPANNVSQYGHHTNRTNDPWGGGGIRWQCPTTNRVYYCAPVYNTPSSTILGTDVPN